MIKVLLFGLTLRDAVGEQDIDVEASQAATVKQLLESNQDRFGAVLPFMMNREVVIIVNRRIGTEDSPVKDGDVVKLSYQSRYASHDGVRDIPV